MKKMLDKLINNDEMHDTLVKFLSKILDDTLSAPVNEKLIHDKIIELVTAKEIMDSISVSLIAVVNREDVKKEIGDNVVDTSNVAVKKYFLWSLGRFM